MKRLTCIFLTLCLLLPMFQSFVYAEENTPQSTEPSAEYQPTLDDIAAGLITPYEYYGELDPETVPEIIGYETAKSRLHVRRMYDEEDDLNTIVFMNADTTRTKYYFGHPVKYVDENGITRDISLNIVSDTQNTNTYVTEANSVTSTFSRTLSDGISLDNDNVSITLVPIVSNANNTASAYSLQNNAQAQLINNKTVSYYYDEKTTIEYKLTYTGFKEDIVVSEYTGQTEYHFTLYTDGLYLSCVDGSYYLVDSDDAVRATLGDIIIFTADERNNTMGSMTSVTVRAGQEYILTIHVDAEYLADERTTYPIRIDPTFEITDGDPIGAMEDVMIRQNHTYSGTFPSTYIGRFSDGTLSRLLVRFPYFNFNAVNTNATFITSATVELRDLMCSGVEDITIDCHIYNMSSPDWSESSGATWTSVGNSYVGTLLDSHLVSFGKGNVSTDWHRYSFDITEAAKMWANGTQSPQKGLVFKASSSFENQTGTNIKYWYKTFASYNRAEYKPSFSFTFVRPDSTQILENGTYYINNLKEGKYIQRNGNSAVGTSGLLANLGTSIQIILEKADEGYIIKSASDPRYILCGHPSMPYVNFGIPSSGDIPDEAKWDITYTDQTGVKIKNLKNNLYLIYTSSGLQVSSLPASTHENYSLYCWRTIKTSTYGASSAYANRELSNLSGFSNYNLENNQTIYFNINKYYTSEIWCDTSTDFNYTLSNAEKITLYNDCISALKRGIVNITATHKVTNRVFSFEVFVKNPLLNEEQQTAILQELQEIEGIGLAGVAGYYQYTVAAAWEEVAEHDSIITQYCNTYKIPKEFVQAVLFREIWLYNTGDAAADVLVQDYYAWMEGEGEEPLTKKSDSSTGLAQIFATTAIKALNNADSRGFISLSKTYNSENWVDVWEVWQQLHDNTNIFNINCCSLVILDCQYEFEDVVSYNDFFDYSESQVKIILSRYNGTNADATEYGNVTYEYFCVFEQYNN